MPSSSSSSSSSSYCELCCCFPNAVESRRGLFARDFSKFRSYDAHTSSFSISEKSFPVISMFLFSLMHLVLIWISTLSVFLSFLNFPPVFSPAPCCVQCYACETVSLFCFCCVLLQLAACCFGFFFFLRCFLFLVFSFVLVRVLFVPCSVLCVLFFCEHFGFVVT